MVRYDVYEDKVRALKKTLEEAGYSLDVDNLRVKLKELEGELEKPEVWSDIEKSKHLSREAQQIRNNLDYRFLVKRFCQVYHINPKLENLIDTIIWFILTDCIIRLVNVNLLSRNVLLNFFQKHLKQSIVFF